MKRADVSKLFRELGRAGGLERAARMTKKQRSDSAKHAAKARWSVRSLTGAESHKEKR